MCTRSTHNLGCGNKCVFRASATQVAGINVYSERPQPRLRTQMCFPSTHNLGCGNKCVFRAPKIQVADTNTTCRVHLHITDRKCYMIFKLHCYNYKFVNCGSIMAHFLDCNGVPSTIFFRQNCRLDIKQFFQSSNASFNVSPFVFCIFGDSRQKYCRCKKIRKLV